MPHFQARATRADGTPVLRIDVSYPFTEHQAAVTLAVMNRDERMLRRVHALIDGLIKAKKDGILHPSNLRADDTEAAKAAKYAAHLAGLESQVSPESIEGYAARLRELDVFPAAQKREEMLAQLRDAQERAKAITEADEPDAAQRAKLKAQIVQQARRQFPRLFAYQLDETTGEPVATIEVGYYFDLEQTALAMAMHYGTGPEPSMGRATVRKALQAVSRDRLLYDPDAVARVSAELVREYRQRLLALGVFELPQDALVKLDAANVRLYEEWLSRASAA